MKHVGVRCCKTRNNYEVHQSAPSPFTNTSVNPARSTAVALFAVDWAISQLWLFWVAPITGALLAGIVYRFFDSPD
ncbi:MAG: aquaporin [Nitrospirae bacterium]|nr:aquaporin [Nitrospirota bacterium]